METFKFFNSQCNETRSISFGDRRGNMGFNRGCMGMQSGSDDNGSKPGQLSSIAQATFVRRDHVLMHCNVLLKFERTRMSSKTSGKRCRRPC